MPKRFNSSERERKASGKKRSGENSLYTYTLVRCSLFIAFDDSYFSQVDVWATEFFLSSFLLRIILLENCIVRSRKHRRERERLLTNSKLGESSREKSAVMHKAKVREEVEQLFPSISEKESYT